MNIRRFAIMYGVVFLVIGLAGLVPAFLTPLGPTDPDLEVNMLAGRLFGLFPVNVLHSLTHLTFGIWGIVAYKSIPKAITYAKAVAVIYGVFLVMGFIPGLKTVFGLVPLHGHDIWLHLILAGVAAYFGFFARTTSGQHNS